MLPLDYNITKAIENAFDLKTGITNYLGLLQAPWNNTYFFVFELSYSDKINVDLYFSPANNEL